jgi:hypothetical protein
MKKFMRPPHMPDPIMTATMIQVVFISPRSTEQMSRTAWRVKVFF